MGSGSIRSPLAQHEHSAVSLRPTPSTPTPSQPKFTGDFMRKPISWEEFNEKAKLRDDRIFDEFRAELRKATTIVTFVWKPNGARAKFVPIP